MEACHKKSVTLVKRKLGGFGLLLDRKTGIISHIVKGGEAESAGMEVGDFVISLNEEKDRESSVGEIVDALSQIAVGKSVVIGSRRNQQMQSQASSSGESLGAAAKPPHSSLTGEKQEKKYIRVNNYISNKDTIDTLHQNSEEVSCSKSKCMGSMMFPSVRPYGKMRPKQQVKEEAVKFLKEYFISVKKNDTLEQDKRIAAALKEIEESGTYELDIKEIIYGAKTAWRNAARCIGRIQWNKLQLFDARDVTTASGMFDAICKHIKYGTNKGNIRSTITVFPQRREEMKDFRIWNAQFIKYAGYQLPDGTVIGDPTSVKITQICESMGWKGKGGRFDVLPLILQASGQDPEMFTLPPELVMEVNISHPKYDWFTELGLRWYCLPAVSSMLFDVGGVDFPCAPFNGWYMASEIGARNFGDVYRYNQLQPVAKRLGLDTRTNTSLWKDIALVELNIAVLHSFTAAGATIMDHHSASESFMKHLDNEQKLRGGCPADWVWIVPPISGSSCPVFHQEMLMYKLKPTLEYQEDPWKYFSVSKRENSAKKRLGFKEVAKAVKLSAKLMGEAMAKRHKAIILYATETGKSENYAKILGELFSHAFDPKVMSMADYNFPELEHEQLLLIVTSTFGNGEAPTNGEAFGEMLYKLKYPPSGHDKRLTNIHIPQFGTEEKRAEELQLLANLRFSVFGLGSRAYPHFCAFAHSCKKLIDGLGGEEIFAMGEGDELCGQEESFMSWAKGVFKAACETFCADVDIPLTNAVERLTDSSTAWKEGKFRYVVDETGKKPGLLEGLSAVYNKKAFPVTVISREKLQHPDSSRSTILVRMNTGGNQELAYEPGDHLAVFPENRGELVTALIGSLDNVPPCDQPIRIEISKEISGPFGSTKKWEIIKRFSQPFTLRQMLTQFLDVTSPPTPQMLLQLATQATDENDKEILLELGKGSSTYEDWKYDRFPNMVEVMQQFPSLKVNFMLLLTQLPLLQSRYYSISSSPLLYPGEVHVTVSVVNYRTQGGQGPLHHGVCSTWLDSLQPGDVVPCLIRSAPSFHLPEDPSTPIIMVGPGTGIAPFRAFWQNRLIQKNRMLNRNDGSEENCLGTMELYFGCRNSNVDFIYKEELVNMQEGGVLDNLQVALSRQPEQTKCYVQDLLKSDSESVCETIMLHDGHIYVCGDVSMASDVSHTLQIMLQEFAALSFIESTNFISKMRSSGRYHEDIFGVTLRTAEVTDRVRTAARKLSRAGEIEKKGKKFSMKSIIPRSKDAAEKETILEGKEEEKVVV